jgi:hypothetical protein
LRHHFNRFPFGKVAGPIATVKAGTKKVGLSQKAGPRTHCNPVEKPIYILSGLFFVFLSKCRETDSKAPIWKHGDYHQRALVFAEKCRKTT